MTEKMTVLIVRPAEKPEVVEIEHTLETLQGIVGGYIDRAYPFFDDDNAAIIFNDEGKINGSRLNRVLYDEDGDIYDVVAGTFIVAGLTTEDFGSLTEEQLKKYAKRFRFPEVFVRADDNILAVVERNGVKQLVPLLS